MSTRIIAMAGTLSAPILIFADRIAHLFGFCFGG